MNNLSRNAPLAIVVGAASCLGSHLTDSLLTKGVQVIGVDDLISGGAGNLKEASKNKKFHLVNQSFHSPLPNDLPRLDYAIFLPSIDLPEREYFSTLEDFLEICKKLKAKILFVSSIDLYDEDTGSAKLKEGERIVAKYATANKLNARVVRLSSIYGPRMDLSLNDPLVKLVKAAVLNRLDEESVHIDAITRAIYVGDAVDLLIKSLFRGGTAQKIYDGARLSPIKIAEIKGVLEEPLWHEKNNFTPTVLPSWPTPALSKTQEELNWSAEEPILKGLKETIHFFKENPPEKGETLESKEKVEERTEKVEEDQPKKESEVVKEEVKVEEKPKIVIRINRERVVSRTKSYAYILIGSLLIVIVLLYPLISLIIDAYKVRSDLQTSREYLLTGDFKNASASAERAVEGATDLTMQFNFFKALEKIGPFSGSVGEINKFISLIDQMTEGYQHTVAGSAKLYESIRIISGEEVGDLNQTVKEANFEFDQSGNELGFAQALLLDPSFYDNTPGILKGEIENFKSKVLLVSNINNQGKVLAVSLPTLTAIDGKKSYLVLLTDNGQLRAGGGVGISWGQVNFEKGRLTGVEVGSVADLDKKLTEQVQPPQELKSDLGLNSWNLAQSGFDPDYPTAARLMSWFYSQEASTNVAGVISMDLTSLGDLTESAGHINLKGGSLDVTNQNLKDSFLSASDKSTFVTDLFKDFLNQMLFVPEQNWAQLGGSLSTLLAEKHILIYVSDPVLFSYLSSQSWTGVMSRQHGAVKGKKDEFLSLQEANMSGNEVNFFINRAITLKDNIDSTGLVTHVLTVDYKNQSASQSDGGGVYKNRLRVYLPQGSSLTSAHFGDQDIMSQINSFSDFGRAGYSILLNVEPGVEEKLTLDYKDANLADLSGSLDYNLLILKQAGESNDKFSYSLTFPTSLNILDEKGDTPGIFSYSGVLDKDQQINLSLQPRS